MQCKYYSPRSGPCNAHLRRLLIIQPWPGLQPGVERQEQLRSPPVIGKVFRCSAVQVRRSCDRTLYLYSFLQDAIYITDAMWGKEKLLAKTAFFVRGVWWHLPHKQIFTELPAGFVFMHLNYLAQFSFHSSSALLCSALRLTLPLLLCLLQGSADTRLSKIRGGTSDILGAWPPKTTPSMTAGRGEHIQMLHSFHWTLL